jgi:hypothetical protein
MPNAELEITEPHAHAGQGSREIRTPFVLNVSSCLEYQGCNESFNHNLLFLAGCKSDFECPDDKACIKRECQDPCLFETCGANAYCKAKSHKAICLCLENHKGDPYRACNSYECLSDPDCPATLTCRQEKCVDPCQCAQNADCSPRNHKGICTCRTGYTGDPYGVACVRSKSSIFLFADLINVSCKLPF